MGKNHEDVSTTIKHLLEEKDDGFRYRLLSRMQEDVKYFLGNGNRYEPHLWAGNAKDHVIIMDALLHSLPEYPMWISTEMIIDYADQMGVGEVFRGPSEEVNEERKPEGKIFTDEESAIIKEALIDQLSQVESDYYTKGVSRRRLIEDAILGFNITTSDQAENAAHQVSMSILRDAVNKRPKILKGYGINSMEEEATHMTAEAMQYADGVLYNKKNGMEQKLADITLDLNEAVKAFNEASQAASSDYTIFNKPILSYEVKKKNDDSFILVATREDGKSYESAYITAHALYAKMEGIQSKLNEQIPALLSEAEKRKGLQESNKENTLSSDKLSNKKSTIMTKKKSQEEVTQQNGTKAEVETKPKKTAAKKSSKAQSEGEAKPEKQEKAEAAKREKRPPQLVIEDGRQVPHAHTFPLNENIGGGIGITAKIDGKALPTRRLSEEDAKLIEAKEVKAVDLLAKYYPNQMAPQLSKENLEKVELNHGRTLDLAESKVWMMHKQKEGGALVNWEDYEKMTPEQKKGIENIPMVSISVDGEKIGTKKISNEEYDAYVNKHTSKAELANKYFDAELSGSNVLSNGKKFEAWAKPSPNDAEITLLHVKMDGEYVGAHKIKAEDAEKLQKGEITAKALVEKVFSNEINGRTVELADGNKANVSVYQTRDNSTAISLWSGNNNLGTARIKPEEKTALDNGTLKPADLAKTYFADKISTGQEQSQSQGVKR